MRWLSNNPNDYYNTHIRIYRNDIDMILKNAFINGQTFNMLHSNDSDEDE